MKNKLSMLFGRKKKHREKRTYLEDFLLDVSFAQIPSTNSMQFDTTSWLPYYVSGRNLEWWDPILEGNFYRESIRL